MLMNFDLQSRASAVLPAYLIFVGSLMVDVPEGYGNAEVLETEYSGILSQVRT